MLTGAVYSGKEFTARIGKEPLFKLINADGKHWGVTYSAEGEYHLDQPFKPTGKATAGGLYFFPQSSASELNKVVPYYNTPTLLADVTIAPDGDTQVYVEELAFKTNKYQLRNFRPFDIATIFPTVAQFMAAIYRGSSDFKFFALKHSSPRMRAMIFEGHMRMMPLHLFEARTHEWMSTDVVKSAIKCHGDDLKLIKSEEVTAELCLQAVHAKMPLRRIASVPSQFLTETFILSWAGNMLRLELFDDLVTGMFSIYQEIKRKQLPTFRLCDLLKSLPREYYNRVCYNDGSTLRADDNVSRCKDRSIIPRVVKRTRLVSNDSL
jgi:hypothetical protein